MGINHSMVYGFMGNDIQDYKDEFIESAQKHLLEIKQNLNVLLSSPTDLATIAKVHIAFHSLKGECIAMGFKNTATVCGKLEKLFAEFKEQKKHASFGVLKTIEKITQNLETSVRSINDRNSELNLQKEITEINDLISS